MRSFFTGALVLSIAAALIGVAVLSALGVAAPGVRLFFALFGIALLLAATLRWQWRNLPWLPIRRGLVPPVLAALGALALAACATAQAGEGKALSAAQDAVAGAAGGVHAAYASGVISKAQVAKAAALVDQADDLSMAARAAYAAGDADTAAGDVAQLVTLAAEIAALKTEKAPPPACDGCMFGWSNG